MADSRPAISQARAAEELGLGAVWIGERYDTKDLPSLAGAISQVTSRTRIGAAITHTGLRHPMVLASMGQTLQSLSDGRFQLGLGRSAEWRWQAYGVRLAHDRVDERHRRDPPQALGRRDRELRRTRRPLPLAPAPPASRAAGPADPARRRGAEDHRGSGSELRRRHPPPLPHRRGGGRLATALEAAAEEAGRDPAAVRCVATVAVAPDTTAEEATLAIESRAAGYLSVPGLGDAIARANGWREEDLARYRSQQLLVDLEGKTADKHLSRLQLIELCKGMPSDWIAELLRRRKRRLRRRAAPPSTSRPGPTRSSSTAPRARASPPWPPSWRASS